MSYQEALEAAGAEVIGFKEFGSYQGDWWAKVKLPDGKIGFVTGSYGSCSGCDAFEAEFGWSDYKSPTYAERFKKFGADYLDQIMDYDSAIKEASTNALWDSEVDGMVNWLKEMK